MPAFGCFGRIPGMGQKVLEEECFAGNKRTESETEWGSLPVEDGTRGTQTAPKQREGLDWERWGFTSHSFAKSQLHSQTLSFGCHCLPAKAHDEYDHLLGFSPSSWIQNECHSFYLDSYCASDKIRWEKLVSSVSLFWQSLLDAITTGSFRSIHIWKILILFLHVMCYSRYWRHQSKYARNTILALMIFNYQSRKTYNKHYTYMHMYVIYIEYIKIWGLHCDIVHKPITCIPYGCQFQSWLHHFWSSPLLMALGKVVEDGPSYTRRRPGKKLLDPVSSFSQCWPLWSSGEWISRWKISLPLPLSTSIPLSSLSLCNFQINTS